MDKNGHLCLTDFGLSKIISATNGEEKRDRLFSFVGTPDYLAPEVTYIQTAREWQSANRSTANVPRFYED